ncbi:FecCD family ABC transporter permease [Listeria ivanovii]|uniref:Putative ferrichrome ABC transporter (Permease) n=1 Tax=Listeria ivanovii (strain ATCC BAA-678 / PAM 55) TaxID=881621 RepID=G2ZCP4_LISIP|nr:iron ABC transporter permease [Listeria ivanovii]AHI56470.1 iron ABC transporter [Listeria ivanovii WSLC3009]AIS65893.1 iron ABC transporter permease [Listeria ivanovii subsp. ivanovii]MBC1759071.1 iron ABC transporter permease [Listeria ivanovii]MBK3914095.1 iron ABC transporter permease [Listeria ivanovii subsp. ivanovii]MBK3921067.1 iron ABC transporter permease [Listeria ivanovii subsp. ivanovii]
MYMTAAEKRKKSRRIWTLIILSVLIFVTFTYSVNAGYSKLPFLEVIKSFFGMADSGTQLIVTEFRLPRIVIALLVGAGLAVSGTILQGISGNGLADPGILGINNGAGLAVMLYISFFPSTMEVPVLFMPFIGFIGAILTAFVVYGLSYSRSEGLLPNRLLLTGIAVAAAIAALITLLSIRLDPQNYQRYAEWMAGNIWASSWQYVFALLPWLVVLGTVAFTKVKTLDVLSFGDQVATGLGVRVEREKFILLIVAVGLAAACVSVSGGIAFIGLIGPHIARKLVGSAHRWVMVTAALSGGLLLLLADTIGRLMIQPSEIFAGIVVAVIGAPYFLFLLAKAK